MKIRAAVCRSFGRALEIEPLGMLFALVASGLWIVTTLYAIGYMRGHHEQNQTRFYICFAMAISGAVGVAFAANVFTLFVFYEAITLSTYPLVTHHGTEAAKRAGRVYLGILMGTSVALLLFALVWTYLAAGTTEFRPGGILAGRVEGWHLAVLLALFAFQVLPVNYAGLGLILLGVILMIAEVMAPSFGALGIGGIIAFVAGSIILMDTEAPGFGIDLSVIFTFALVSVLMFVFVVGMALFYLKREDFEEAAYFAELALKYDPGHPAARRVLAAAQAW